MTNSIIYKILFIFIIFTCIGCRKETITEDDYRIKYTGKYLCEGNCHEWNEATGLDTYYVETIIVIVQIDSFSTNKIRVNEDIIPIDTTGFFTEFYFNGYHDYWIKFLAKDSIYYKITTGGNGGGYWGKFLGKKEE